MKEKRKLKALFGTCKLWKGTNVNTIEIKLPYELISNIMITFSLTNKAYVFLVSFSLCSLEVPNVQISWILCTNALKGKKILEIRYNPTNHSNHK